MGYVWLVTCDMCVLWCDVYMLYMYMIYMQFRCMCGMCIYVQCVCDMYVVCLCICEVYGCDIGRVCGICACAVCA